VSDTASQCIPRAYSVGMCVAAEVVRSGSDDGERVSLPTLDINYIVTSLMTKEDFILLWLG
jgi:hypothetical protein